MDTSEWIKIGLGIAGFLSTWTMGIVGGMRAVSKIKEDTSEKIELIKDITSQKIDNETDRITERLEKLQAQFDQEQRSQDHNFGEVGAAMRAYISNVEKEMHDIEIWGRDHYVLKSEFLNATDSIRSDIRSMAQDIKTDLRMLAQKIETRN